MPFSAPTTLSLPSLIQRAEREQDPPVQIASPEPPAADTDGQEASGSMSPLTMRLLIAFVVLLVVAIILVSSLLILRRVRRKRRNGVQIGSSVSFSNDLAAAEEGEKSITAPGLTITTTTKRSPSGRRTDSYLHVSRLSCSSMPTRNSIASVAGINVRASLSSTSLQPQIPEIRITFPDELDESGNTVSFGQVVVVKMGENSVIGLEPLASVQSPPLVHIEKADEYELPPYSQTYSQSRTHAVAYAR